MEAIRGNIVDVEPGAPADPERERKHPSELVDAFNELEEYHRKFRRGAHGQSVDGGPWTPWDNAKLSRYEDKFIAEAPTSRFLEIEVTLWRCAPEIRATLRDGFDRKAATDMQWEAVRSAMAHGDTLCMLTLACRQSSAKQAYERAHPGKVATPGAIRVWFHTLAQPKTPKRKSETADQTEARRLEALRAAQKRLSGFRRSAVDAFYCAVASYDEERRERVQAAKDAKERHETAVAEKQARDEEIAKRAKEKRMAEYRAAAKRVA